MSIPIPLNIFSIHNVRQFQLRSAAFASAISFCQNRRQAAFRAGDTVPGWMLTLIFACSFTVDFGI
jgi:hypothetical protein